MTICGVLLMIPATIVLVLFLMLCVPSVVFWKVLEWIDGDLAADPF